LPGKSYRHGQKSFPEPLWRGKARNSRAAPIEPRWTRGNKDGVGTAHAASSRTWFTVWNGIITEVYYPTGPGPSPRGEHWYKALNGATSASIRWISAVAVPTRIPTEASWCCRTVPRQAAAFRLRRHVFDLIPAVFQRYLGNRKNCRCLEVWKHKRQCRTVRKGYTLRIQAPDAFRLRWTKDDWQTILDTDSSATQLNIHFADITIVPGQRAPIRFTFFYPQWSPLERVRLRR
jgi:hypothetical protein